MSQAFAQEPIVIAPDEYDECFTPIPPTIDEPTRSLCVEFGPFQFDLEIGEGTAYPRSSDLPDFVSVYPKFKVVGDFEVDVSYTFR